MERTKSSISFENHGVTIGLSKGANWGFTVFNDDKRLEAQIYHEQMQELLSFIGEDSRESQLLEDSLNRNEDLRKRVMNLSASISMLVIKMRELLILYESGSEIPSDMFYELKQLTDNAAVVKDKSTLDETN